MKTYNQTISLNTDKSIHIKDITNEVKTVVKESGIRDGIIAVTSQHTTTALTVNESEERLLIDIDNFFSQLVPADAKYLHNDLHLRDVPPDEPENAHAHICAMMFGNSETVALVEGELKLGTYQSIMLIELDGPRERRVNVQVVGG